MSVCHSHTLQKFLNKKWHQIRETDQVTDRQTDRWRKHEEPEDVHVIQHRLRSLSSFGYRFPLSLSTSTPTLHDWINRLSPLHLQHVTSWEFCVCVCICVFVRAYICVCMCLCMRDSLYVSSLGQRHSMTNTIYTKLCWSEGEKKSSNDRGWKVQSWLKKNIHMGIIIMNQIGEIHDQ